METNDKMVVNIKYLEELYKVKEKTSWEAFALYSEKVIKALKPFPLSRIYIFGSLADGSWIQGRSDIDIALEGAEFSQIADMDE